MIVLIVTIIVMLILAGVSLSLVLGDNGILTQSVDATEKTNLEQAQEAIELAVTSCMGDFTNEYNNGTASTFSKWLTIEKLSNALKNEGYYLCTSNIDNTEYSTSLDLVAGNNLYFTSQSNTSLIYKIKIGTSDEIFELKIGNAKNVNTDTNINSIDIINIKDKTEIYGATVNYIVENSDLQSSLKNDGITWKLFYTDENYIYLIASDYILASNTPQTLNGSSVIVDSETTPYFTRPSNVISDYIGSSNITNKDLQKLNSSYFENYSNSNSSMKAIAYLMDTNIWNIYKGNGTEFVIGSPTIELIINSYNEKYSTNYLAKATSEDGYKISIDNGETWNYACSNIFDSSDSLYVGGNNSKAYGLFVASPCFDSASLFCIGNDGGTGRQHISGGNRGLRPVICLSFDVELELQEDGTYSIVE